MVVPARLHRHPELRRQTLSAPCDCLRCGPRACVAREGSSECSRRYPDGWAQMDPRKLVGSGLLPVRELHLDGSLQHPTLAGVLIAFLLSQIIQWPLDLRLAITSRIRSSASRFDMTGNSSGLPFRSEDRRLGKERRSLGAY